MLGEKLECKKELGNPHDTHAVTDEMISGSNVSVCSSSSQSNITDL